MEVAQEQIDKLVMAVDRYATECTKRQRHLKGRWVHAVRQYERMTGLSFEEAEARMKMLIS